MTAEEVMAWMMLERRWEHNYVVSPLNVAEDVLLLQKRPFFVLLAVDAPLGLRFQRFQAKYHHRQHMQGSTEWETFIRLTDQRPTLLNNANQVLHNTFTSLDDFHAYLSRQQPSLNDEIRCRPSWDDYFMLLADLASYRSNCMKRRVGCIVVRDHRVIATGYNGTPRGLTNCNEGGCTRCNDGAANNTLLSECLCMHAEENALLEAGRERISGRQDECTVVYCNTFPCLGCAKKMIQVGIKEVVYRMEYGMDTRVGAMMKEAGLSVRQHRPSTRLHLENWLNGHN